MTKSLRDIIERLIHALDRDTFGRKTTMEITLKELKAAYHEHRDNMTETSKRIEFLRNCLEEGKSKREAARMLVIHDPRVGQKTAETLVYINFSGEYRTTMRGCRRSKPAKISQAVAVAPVSVDDDESII